MLDIKATEIGELSANTMQSIKRSLLLITLCLSAGGTWAKPSLAVFEGVWNDLADGGKSIVEGLRNATKDGAATRNYDNAKDNDFLQNFDDKFLEDAGQLGDDLSNAITEALNTGILDLSQYLKGNILALRVKVSAEKNRIKKQSLSIGLEVLEQLSSAADELQSGLANINQKLAEKVNSQLNETIIDLLQWGEEQLKHVEKGTDGVGLPQATEIVNLLTERYTKNLLNALDELEYKKSLLEQHLNDKVDEYSGYAEALIEAMNSCGRVSSLSCQDSINEMEENLRTAQNELHIQLRKGHDLVKEGVYSSESILNLMKMLAVDKLKCENDLEDIIDENPSKTEEANEPTTPLSGGSSSPSPSSSYDPSASFGDMLAKLSDASRSLLQALWNGTAFGEGLLKSLDEAKGNFLVEVAQLGKDLSNAVSESLTTKLGELSDNLKGNITALEGKIKGVNNILLKRALNNGLGALKDLNSTAVELQSALTEISQKLGDQLNDQVDNAIAQLAEWGQKKLAEVSKATDGAGSPQAKDIVQLLIERFTRSLTEAVTEFQSQKAYFEQQLEDKISEYSAYAKALIVKLNRCVTQSSAFLCQANTAELIGQILNSQNELQSVLRRSKALIRAGTYARESLASLLTLLEKEKDKIDKILQGIIDDNRSDTESPEESTEPDEATTLADEN